MDENKRCCFCGAELPHYGGNNPAPADMREESECCDLCNSQIVIPARIFIENRIRSAVGK